MKVTNIEVAYGRKMQPQAYESAECSVKMALSFEDDAVEVDAAISKALDTVQEHVLNRLGIRRLVKADAVAAIAKAQVAEIAPAAAENKPLAAAKDNAPKVAAKAAPEVVKGSEAAAKEISDADMLATITAKLTEMRAAGKTDGGRRIVEITSALLPEGQKTPPTPNRIPQAKRAQFVASVKALA